MNRLPARRARLAAAPVALAGALLAPAAFAQDAPRFTEAQAGAGAAVYALHCAACHGPDGGGASIAPPVRGAAFLATWGGAPLDQLYAYLRNSMPPGGAGGLDDTAYADVLAWLMQANGAAPGEDALPADPVQLAQMAAPPAPPPRRGPILEGVAGLEAPTQIAAAPAHPDRFADYAPVTDAVLADPPPEDWPGWRRGHLAQGFSPLDEITPQNVARLGVAWAQALPMGPNMNEPLVREGVMYVHAYGDEVFALDAATGRVIWRYQRHAPQGAPRGSKKTMALYGDKLYVVTADAHMLALDARTGRPVWDTPITGAEAMRIPGGPIAADGVVMTGVATQAPGGAIIAGFNADTGEQVWTFNTVAQPGQPGGDTWNGLPAEARSGGSSWTSGSYDPQSGLAYWGAGPTYDTLPLRDLIPGENNDALFTDATMAIDPRTGELVWFYQHMKNDQWDFDWVFERTVADLEIDGQTRRVVMTAGKPSIFDVLDAATGDYLFSIDMGLQNFIADIDPETGEKTYDPAMTRVGLEPMRVCPNGGGGRNWQPTAFNPHTRVMFVGTRDICMDLIPTGDGSGLLTTGVTLRAVPSERSAQDGLYGLLRAIDMETGETVWDLRQRAAPASGTLATAGGLVFSASMDRQLTAYDQATGEALWRAALIDGAVAAPISYAVDGRQYVAVVVGRGNPLAESNALTPEIETPPVGAAAVTVFALPE